MAITRTPLALCFNTGNVVWTNMPLASTELFGLTHRRAKKDLTDAHTVRLVARVSTQGTAASNLIAQYSTDEAAWSTLTSACSLAAIATAASAWAALPAGARGDVFIRIMGAGGDGVADPVIGNVYLEFL